ncbi:hypothetical protein AHMF7605_05270 [Adhaeribacter arboris]|uniref:DZANK-type domain-containing protein n=1 Tax=Adhaeribacter arboris TaxID=2072846 RepID=A0A2T2YBT7_9BACT|nr:zinc ribbon domain-containing protein [Adhaeribacter arboris]PSR52977.1 hypothetical protein AHMF7605_05270 [Adhaeribacter arboris]
MPKSLVCQSCSVAVIEDAFFCHNCGLQVKCKGCGEKVISGSKNCSHCGLPVIKTSHSTSINTFKLRENKEERIYEIEFTNEVGKEIKEVIADLLKNKLTPTDNEEQNVGQLVTTESVKQAEVKELIPAPTTVTSPQLEVTPLPIFHTGQEDREAVYPHLNDLEIRLDCKENEWLLLFSFYNSNFGANTFTKDIIWQLYKDKRKTETRFKNLGTNWRSLFKKYLATVKENEFRFTNAGLQKVKSLLRINHDNAENNFVARKSNSVSNTRMNTIRTMPVSRKVVANSIVPNEFDVYKNEYKEALEAFFRRKNPGNGNPNRIITIAYYITKINHQEYFTEGNIDYAYRILNLNNKPAHLKQIIINLKNERLWFQKIIDNTTTGWKLTRQGEIYVEEKLPARA